ncbi:hypothetical protein NGRA_2122 [Nosema granulosis]|uniref:SKI-interacting protein SKIP SNW domain-containing protein n=1 Tax=Nosema granulosis TaxID=83296 RepID=A0A9P6KYR2_9MICR|nr:hypothetical protein NGRA_2122 [Nosema granulosis]
MTRIPKRELILDPCRVEKKAIKKYKRKKTTFPNVKNNFIVPRVLSMWKNPTSEIVPLEERVKQRRSKETRIAVDVKQIVALNKALDQIEDKCKNKKAKKQLKTTECFKSPFL